ncbi:hypothetical protein CgunFtcFv8_024532 [Champsocephalus gunnari]|uniref:Uncharacterized protein n=1 Tax=Champsocephalus gunnari TaxID=52237 RepID=A0AAN8DEN7_CHAGU|nr:hypothetical protein CgunFtcFv8_024532 [Champsocephalus gunnari]
MQIVQKHVCLLPDEDEWSLGGLSGLAGGSLGLRRGQQSAYDSTALVCRTPIRLSALQDRLIDALHRSLYLSSQSLEMA